MAECLKFGDLTFHERDALLRAGLRKWLKFRALDVNRRYDRLVEMSLAEICTGVHTITYRLTGQAIALLRSTLDEELLAHGTGRFPNREDVASLRRNLERQP